MQTHSSDDAQETDADATLTHARTTILRYLRGRDERVENLSLVTAAVRSVALDGGDLDATDLPFPEVHERVTERYLPELDRDGLVAYDRSASTVTLAGPPDELDDAGQRHRDE